MKDVYQKARFNPFCNYTDRWFAGGLCLPYSNRNNCPRYCRAGSTHNSTRRCTNHCSDYRANGYHST
jgi:hypothetical protein